MKREMVTTVVDGGAPIESVFERPELGDPCARCGERPSTREIMIMVERPGGVAYYCDECANGPQWTTTPPTEPGWTREQKDAVYEFARFLQKKMGLAKPRIYIGYADEFVGEKTVRIPEPPR